MFYNFQVQNILFSMTPTGLRHRDHAVTGSVLSAHVNSGIKEYFFGKNLEKRLTVQRFIQFQKNLQQEVMYLEVGIVDNNMCSVVLNKLVVMVFFKLMQLNAI